MKPTAHFVLGLSMFTGALFGQARINPGKELPYEIQISPEIAEKLLVFKPPISCPLVQMPAHITGTVVVAIQIGQHGEVDFSKVISGPAVLRKPVLKSVRSYKYKPYLLNGKAVTVESTVSVKVDSDLDCRSR